LRVFYGGRGIWTDKARTSTLSSDGVTVGVLHTGRSYARIGEVVGHADLVTTERTYTHVLVDEEELDYGSLLDD
jgi:integrase